MRNLFKNLKIGDKFHTGKSKGMGIKSDNIFWLEFEKIDKSHAKVINQVNYGNTRMVGSIKPFSANSPVWEL